MEILLITNPNPTGTGGQRRSYFIIRELAKMIKSNLYLVVYGSKNSLRDIMRLGIDKENLLFINEMQNSSVSYVFNVLTVLTKWEHLNRWINNIQPDIIVAHDETFWYMLLAYKLHKATGYPYTFLLQEMPVGYHIFEHHIRKIMNPLEVMINVPKLLLGNILGFKKVLKSSVPIMISKAMVHRLMLVGLSSYIHSPIVLDVPVGLEWNLIKKSSLIDIDCDAVFIARLIPEKGLFDIPKIWYNVVKEVRNTKLCVAGSFYRVEHKRKFMTLIRKYELEGKVRLLGYIDEHTKHSLLKSSKIFLYPSRQDSFGIVVLEALACGLPVVAYNIPAIYYNFNTKSVIRVPIDDYNAMAEHIIELLTNDSLRNTLSNEGITFAKKYTWENAARSEIEAYKRVLDLWGDAY